MRGPTFGRREKLIIALDGLLGVPIGAATVGSRAAASPLMTEKLAGFELGAGFTLLVLGVPMLLATLVLAPLLVWFLRQRAELPTRSYYASSAIAGVLFGIAASVGVGFFTGLLLPFVPQVDATLEQRLMMSLGAPALLAFGFGLSSLLFWWQLLVTGVGFGLLNGWLVRRGASRG